MTEKTPPAAAQPGAQDPIATEARIMPAADAAETPQGPNPDLARAEVEGRLQTEALYRAVQAPRTVAVPAAPATR